MESTLKYLPPYEITGETFISSHSSSIISLLNRYLDFNEELYIAETLAVDDLNGKFVKQYIAVSNIYDTNNIREYLFQVHKFIAAGGIYIGFAEKKQRPTNLQLRIKHLLLLTAFPGKVKFNYLISAIARNIPGKFIRSKTNISHSAEIIDYLFDAGFNVTDYTEENNIFMFIARKYKHLYISRKTSDK